MSDRFWHIAQNGIEEGPFSVRDICAKINEGSITSDAYIFKIGTHKWVPIIEREEFVEEFRKIPPPPSPEPIPTPAQTVKPASVRVPTDLEQEDGGAAQNKIEKQSKKTRKSFRRLIGRLFLAATLGFGVFTVSEGSIGAAGIAATLGLALGASPAGWLSMVIGAVGLKFAYESYDPKPYCIYFSDSKVIGSITKLSTQCFSDRHKCMNAVPFYAATGKGPYVGCWNTCKNWDEYNCKVRTLMEGHRAR